MYRGDGPVFCRGCGTRWMRGAANCTHCGEPVQARLVSDAFGRKLPAFTRQRGLVWALTILTIVYTMTVVSDFVTGWTQRDVYLELVETGHLDREGLEALTRRLWSTLFSTTAFLGVTVLFGVWLVRAGRNLRALGVVDARDVDEARLLWFFVPVLHLYRPLLGIRQLWQGSRAPDPGRWQRERVPAVLWCWWPVWLASNALGNASLYTWLSDQSVSARLTAAELDLGWAAARLLCVPLFLAVVWGIERAQARRG